MPNGIDCSSRQIACWKAVPSHAMGKSKLVRVPAKYSLSWVAAVAKTALEASVSDALEWSGPIVTLVIAGPLAVITRGPSGESMVNDCVMTRG